jgi:hypothetical protein
MSQSMANLRIFPDTAKSAVSFTNGGKGGFFGDNGAARTVSLLNGNSVRELNEGLEEGNGSNNGHLPQTTKNSAAAPVRLTRPPLRMSSKQTSLKNFMNADPNISSPTRRYKLENVAIDAELLAAGTDPLAKNQDFSRLASNASSLISA